MLGLFFRSLQNTPVQKMCLFASVLKGNLEIGCLAYRRQIQIGLSKLNLVKGLAATWIASI